MLAGIVPLKRPSPNQVVVLAILMTPFLVTAMVRYPWLAAAAVLAPCGLALVRRPWRGGLLIAPLAVIGGMAGLPWWCAPLLALVTAAMCLGFPAQVRFGSEHVIVALLVLLLVVSWVFPAGQGAPGHLALHDMTQVTAGLMISAVCAAAPSSAERLLTVVALSGMVVAVAALLIGDAHDGTRLQGFGLNPNYLGSLLVLPMVVSFAMAWLRRALLWAVPGAVALVTVAATDSRGAVFAVVAGLAAIVLLRGSRSARLLLASAIAVVAVLAATVPGGLNVSSGIRGAAELERNNDVRAQSAVLAARMAAEYPLRGMGYGTFPEQAARSPQLGIFINTHNDYLRLAAESGVVSALLLVLLVCRAVRRAAGAYEHILAGGIVAYAVVLLFGNTLSNLMASTQFWVCLGALLGARRRETVRDGSPDITAHGARHMAGDSDG
ncbi:O-antigen ligase family protein [Streptosporangium sp. NBC_01639]|uniref:O-antigen ligase family protein n=1 Tax=Streptosporangium sp. NBC_01639 TaxID=2975948 RepID=UPI00386E0BDF|nr:O-antigen ligase family protein [Streptosporangium sp. NBC_01639]